MTFPPDFWDALWLTVRLAFVSTLLLLIMGLPLAVWLARRKARAPLLAEALLALPVVLPPTVIAFYLLVIFGPRTLLGGLWARALGQPLAFGFPGLVLGSVVYSLPFAIQPFRAGLARVSRELLDVARINGASALATFWHVTLPVARKDIAAGAVLSFSHTLGAFGVVLMLGGDIPGRTRVVSIALFDDLRNTNYPAAQACAAVLLVIAFILILTVTLLQRRPVEAA